MVVLRWGEATDVGRVRTNNEDALFTSDRLFAVADGMGGHQGGEVASDTALRTLGQAFVESTTEGLLDAAHDANDAVLERAAGDPDLRGMGTTLVAIAPMEDSEAIAWVNVGDSRLYLLRDGDLTQISEDHSLVQEAVRAGDLSPEEAQTHPQRNIVTRALGIDPDIEIDGDESTRSPATATCCAATVCTSSSTTTASRPRCGVWTIRPRGRASSCASPTRAEGATTSPSSWSTSSTTTTKRRPRRRRWKAAPPRATLASLRTAARHQGSTKVKQPKPKLLTWRAVVPRAVRRDPRRCGRRRGLLRPQHVLRRLPG